MPSKQTLRSLCLLALLQVVAGPLILFPSIFLGKVASVCSEEQNLTAAVGKLFQGDVWQMAADSSLELVAVLDSQQKDSPSSPPKPKQAKDSLLAVEWLFTRFTLVIPISSYTWQSDTDLHRRDHIHSPAIPPPRSGSAQV